MSKIDVYNKILIFPKATAFLMEKGYSVTVTGRRQCDIKLLSYLVSNEMEGVNIPDISIYDTKTRKWNEMNVLAEDTLSFTAGRNGSYVYYPRLMEKDRIELLIGFITAYSGNSLLIERKPIKVTEPMKIIV